MLHLLNQVPRDFDFSPRDLEVNQDVFAPEAVAHHCIDVPGGDL